jgi:hypothetical protein
MVIYGKWIQSKKLTRRNTQIKKKSITATYPFSHFCGRPPSVSVFTDFFTPQNKPEDLIFSASVTSVWPTPGHRTDQWFVSILQAAAVCKWSLTYTSKDFQCLQKIITLIKLKKVNWAEYLACMGKREMCSRFLLRKKKRRIQLGA